MFGLSSIDRMNVRSAPRQSQSQKNVVIPQREICVGEAVVDGQRLRVARLALRDHPLGRQDAEKPLAAA